MKTVIFDHNHLHKAADLLKAGELVAFPTETVYGLGAISNNEEAVAKVFQAKGRPSDNPLIVHVASQNQVQDLTEEISPLAQKLMDTFWPGPLTIVFPLTQGRVASNVTGGKDSVAIRMPDQAMTLELIRLVGLPLVGPSANLSGKPSPTSVEHVLNDFDGVIAGIVDNGQDLTDVGVESTVVYPHDGKVDVLRPGYITPSQLREELFCEVNILSEEKQLSNLAVASPGVKYRHYSPKQPVYLVKYPRSVEEWYTLINETDASVGLLADDQIIFALRDLPQVKEVYSLGPVNDWSCATQRLFSGLRTLEKANCDRIYIQGLEYDEKTLAFMNRVTKASSYVL
ncbi:L-threonylcarbamoyladenylate synthase [Facklamia miroungae]|uniref:Threonylcarbamoyl-AMP synthase n=1 Tax=Facklamia miroungae TaxID=120956 RepID=A0A1G7TUL5_9LACT|nr:L-threonylcarbamoyladenylate synthase [Facklamia miroungae]NKZ29952.1 threonylcarbamoyl-AMP synthase [Facklamia miroungae]SDG38220.1 L-threonylcarbamoyladenylate synthase [Facklamia miroungae]